MRDCPAWTQPDDPLSSTLGRLVGSWLLLQCPEPKHPLTFYPLALLAGAHGRRTALCDVLPRFRCSKCRQPPGAMALVEQPYVDKARMHEDDVDAGWRIPLDRGHGARRRAMNAGAAAPGP